MRLDGVRPGSMVKANMRGWEFWARAIERVPGGVQVVPPYNCSHHFIPADRVRAVRRPGFDPGPPPQRVSPVPTRKPVKRAGAAFNPAASQRAG